MGCKSCSSGGCGTKAANGKVAGCQSNGGCSTGGCNKMNVFDWLSNMEMPGTSTPGEANYYDIIEVKFKGGRKEYYRNQDSIPLVTGDAIIVDVPNGHHLGFVSLQGELVRLQMLKKGIKSNGEIRTIYRVANAKDLEKFEQAQARDMPTLFRTRQIVDELKLDMKLSDVEYQADNTKATFYYSAEERVDFRELIKLLAGEFKIRVEMKQISLRQEAGRLGGIGVCGRELCCSTWLSDFKSVSTAAARYQNLSLNPSKLSGQCGRLKCCLNYELETYMDALKDIPTVEAPLLTKKGVATLQKTDIFKKIMWFGYDAESTWYPVSVEKVNQILEMNRKGIKPESLDILQEVEVGREPKAATPLNDDLDRMDKKYTTKSGSGKKKSKKKKKGGQLGQDKVAQERASLERADSDKPIVEKPRSDKPSFDKSGSGRPNQGKPSQGKPNFAKSSGGKTNADKSRSGRHGSGKPSNERANADKPSQERSNQEKLGVEKPSAERSGSERPSSGKPSQEKPNTNPIIPQ